MALTQGQHLMRLSALNQQLAEARTLTEVKELGETAEALRYLARKGYHACNRENSRAWARQAIRT